MTSTPARWGGHSAWGGRDRARFPSGRQHRDRAELVDVAQGTQLWGERYDTHPEDILGVQEEIARDVSRGLRLKLAPGALQTGSQTVDPEAYRLYLLSRHELTKVTLEGKTKVLETPALAAEARVWRELSASQAARSR
jgi:hypothetical protein